MVMIFNDAESTTIPLEELQTMTPPQVIQKITNKEPDCLTFLSKCGVRFPDNLQLASANLFEQDFLRVIHAEAPTASTNTTKTGRELLAATREEKNRKIDSLRKKCQERYKELTQKEQNRVYYMEVLNILTDPDFFQKQLNKFPDLVNHPDACAYVADPLMCFAVLKDGQKFMKLQNSNFCYEHPVILDVIVSVLALENFKPKMKIGPGMAEADAAAAARLQAPAAGPSNAAITAEMLQNAISFAMGNPAAVAPQNVPAPVAAPQEDVLAPFREQYAEQLQQLRECGFSNDNQNLEILVQCDGNVATAMEILIDEANPQQ